MWGPEGLRLLLEAERAVVVQSTVTPAPAVGLHLRTAGRGPDPELAGLLGRCSLILHPLTGHQRTPALQRACLWCV